MKFLKVLFAVTILFLSSCTKTKLNSVVHHIDSVTGSAYDLDTLQMTITPIPTQQDDAPTMTAVWKYQESHPSYLITLQAATYYAPNGPMIIVDSIANGTYQQAYINIEGANPAKDINAGFSTNWNCNGPCLLLQQVKGAFIQNIGMTGTYTKSAGFTEVQIDTSTRTQWEQTGILDNPTAMNAGIIIDPFNDPGYFTNPSAQELPGLSANYIVGMNTAGSTNVTIQQCSFKNFPVGIVITAGYQQNGDLININNCQIGNCITGIAFTQAQSKDCWVNNIMVWGGVRDILDGITYGAHKADGSICPTVLGGSIAGNNYEFIFAYAVTFSVNVSDVMAENIFKWGQVVGSAAGINFSNIQVDFQVSAPNVPSPDFYYYGENTSWIDCTLRDYNGGATGNRIVLNGYGNTFTGGSMSTPPLCLNSLAATGNLGPELNPPTFTNVSMFYEDKILNSNNYDSLIEIGANVPAFIDSHMDTGYLIAPSLASYVNVKDLIVTSQRYTEFGLTAMVSSEYPVGFVSSVRGDTVSLVNTGTYIYTSSLFRVWDCKIKSGF